MFPGDIGLNLGFTAQADLSYCVSHIVSLMKFASIIGSVERLASTMVHLLRLVITITPS
jgi:hypothetical protein